MCKVVGKQSGVATKPEKEFKIALQQFNLVLLTLTE